MLCSNFFLFLPGEPLARKAAAAVPKGYWNFSWVAEDNLSFPYDSMPLSGELDRISPPSDRVTARGLPRCFPSNWP